MALHAVLGRIALPALVMVLVGCSGGGGGENSSLIEQSLTFASAGTATLNVGDDYSNPASGQGSGALSYSSSNTAVATVSAGGLVHAVAAGATRITASIAADAQYASATASYDVTVAATGSSANRAPSIGGTPPLGLADRAFTFTPSVSDPDGDPLQLSASNVPAWLAFDASTGTLSGTPTSAQIGTSVDVVVTASDGALSTDLVARIVVEEPGIAAALESGDHRRVPDEATYLDAIIDTIDSFGLSDRAALRAMAENLETGGFTFNAQLCVSAECNEDPTTQTELLNVVEGLKSEIDALDQAKTNVFDLSDAYRLQKLVVLLADHYRQEVTYPISPSDRDELARAMFADHVVHVYRPLNPTQPNLGTFSRSDFSHITPEAATVELTSRQPFRAAGVYVLPGQTVSITRLDSSPVRTYVRVNSLRANPAKIFAHETKLLRSNGYKRPLYLSSTPIEVLPGETIALTSPYGGPLHIYFDANDEEVSFHVEDVGRHPFWDDPSDTPAFLAALAEERTTGRSLLRPISRCIPRARGCCRS